MEYEYHSHKFCKITQEEALLFIFHFFKKNENRTCPEKEKKNKMDNLCEIKRMIEINIQMIQTNQCYELHMPAGELWQAFFSIGDPQKLQRELQQWNALLEKVNQEIWSRCEHDFVTDTIDLTPEKSQTIYYCKHCFLEPRPFKLF